MVPHILNPVVKSLVIAFALQLSYPWICSFVGSRLSLDITRCPFPESNLCCLTYSRSPYRLVCPASDSDGKN